MPAALPLPTIRPRRPVPPIYHYIRTILVAPDVADEVDATPARPLVCQVAVQAERAQLAFEFAAQ